MTYFVPLTGALERWLDKPLAKLPKTIQSRVREELYPMLWDELSAAQRRSAARLWDSLRDAAAEQGFDANWDPAEARRALQQWIEAWESVAVPTARDLELKERRLEKLKAELARTEEHERRISKRRRAAPASDAGVRNDGPYIGYVKALRRLRERLNATPEELAAWIFFGSSNGGIDAYLNANGSQPPEDFRFQNYHHPSYDSRAGYLKLSMNCWFLEKDVEDFIPTMRFITYEALAERWSNEAGITAADYIEVQIAQSRLQDIHPMGGQTQGSNPGNKIYPLLESALFLVEEIEKIELEDFGRIRSESPQQRKERLTKLVEKKRAANDKAFLKSTAKEEGISTSRLKQIIGKKSRKTPLAPPSKRR